MGMLKVTGTIDTTSIWPAGRSDADTVRLQIDVTSGGFFFRSTATGAFKRTRVFDKGFIKGKFGAPKSPISKGKVTVRLQGIDSPELHYRPEPLPNMNTTEGKKITAAQRTRYHDVNHEYRQKQGETSSKALHDFLSAKGGPSVLPCTILTQVDLPGDPFDSYGRLVGDVIVKIGGKDVNINQWLCRSGWTLPAFYNSMTNAEINVLLKLCKTAKQQQVGLWKFFSKQIAPFDFGLVYEDPKKVPVNMAKDKGKFIIPKVFRRLTTYAARKKAGIVNATFPAWVATQHKSFVPLALYLLHGTNGAKDFLENHLIQNTFDLEPDQMVFTEDVSVLLSGPTATSPAITKWF